MVDGTKAEVTAVRYLYRLKEPAVVIFPQSGTVNGKVGLYAINTVCLGDALSSVFSGLNTLAEKLLLRTNVSQIGQRAAHLSEIEMNRKESDAQEEMKEDGKLALPTPSKKKEELKPDFQWGGEDFGYGPLHYLKLTGKVINFSKKEEHERIEEFKKKYLTLAIDVLKTVKKIFPKDTCLQFVDVLKNLKIEPIQPNF